MSALLASLGMVIIAEMGDKTQLLAMAFAAKYRASQVLWGVFFGALLNHGLAVLIGTYLGNVLPMNAIGVAAGGLFLLFALWGLRPEAGDEDERRRSKFGPIITVALSFFIGEMGDKTQLTTLAMAVEYRQPIYVLVGAVSGMLVADGLGVIVGDWLLRKIPSGLIKLISAAVFVIFGEVEFYEHLGPSLLTVMIMITTSAMTVAAGWYLLWKAQQAQAKALAAKTEHVA